jgi:LysM repeat protein
MARRWLFYLAINVFVSAATMLAVLYLWDRSKQGAAESPFSLTGTLGNRPTWTATPPKTPSQFLYTVRQGDTLGSIAEQFKVSQDELLAVNPEISDPNSLSEGQVIRIPPSAEAEAVAQYPTVTPRPSEVFPWPIIEGVDSPGNLDGEMIRIKNPGPVIDLTGWTIRSPSGADYVFPAFSLFPQGAVNLHTGSGTDSIIDLYWGLDAPIWNSGDVVMLSDAQGGLRSVFIVP